MKMRSSWKSVTFTKPFSLGGIDGVQKAGTYEICTDEEQLENLSASGWRRVATTILVRSGGLTQSFLIDPVDLDASLMRDAGQTRLPEAAGN